MTEPNENRQCKAAGAGRQDDSPIRESKSVVADDRSGPLAGLSSSAGSVPRTPGETQSASFAVGSLRLELTASPGAARLVVGDARAKDTYVVDPESLAAWAAATRKLLALRPAKNASDRMEYRAPFLFDREHRASIAFEGLVSEYAVTYRLLVSGASEKVAGLMTTAEVVRGVAEAADGAGTVARNAI